METPVKTANRLTKYFSNKNKGILNIYFTAGYPKLNDTVTIIKAIEESGADIIEIGLPFSDPLADGPTIQRSSEIALQNGMSTSLLFEQLKDIRKEVKIPILLMGYLNPVMQYGVEKFCQKAVEVGIDGLILPDLPYDEYNESYKDIFEAHNLANVFLVTPNTSAERVDMIDKSTHGFSYIVSTDSTTGSTKSILDATEYFQRIRNYNLKNPYLIGFNINSAESFEFASSFSNGAIIGSAFIKALGKSENLNSDIKNFIHSIKNQ